MRACTRGESLGTGLQDTYGSQLGTSDAEYWEYGPVLARASSTVYGVWTLCIGVIAFSGKYFLYSFCMAYGSCLLGTST